MHLIKTYSVKILASAFLYAVAISTPSQAQNANPQAPTIGPIDRKVLPIPEPSIESTVGKTYKDSKPGKLPMPPVAP